MAAAISSPRQRSADGLVRAALATTAGEQSDLVVIEAKDVDAHKIADPLARLVFRVDLDGAENGFRSTGPITACYAAQFNFYGIVGSHVASNARAQPRRSCRPRYRLSRASRSPRASKAASRSCWPHDPPRRAPATSGRASCATCP